MAELAEIAAPHRALTGYEFDGLSARYCFADGHAYHDLDSSQKAIVDRLPALWAEGARQRHRDIERAFAYAFYDLAQQASVANTDNVRICTSASQSIDLACAWAARSHKRIALIEPAFDNLALIARRWGLPLKPIPEAVLSLGVDHLDPRDFDVLFLVTPNNPTGNVIGIDGLQEIAAWCVKHRKTLFVDFCFRFFGPSMGDHYRILEDSGVDYVAIEDTGKTWSTLDMKASLIAYSRSLKLEIEEIFHEIFLCVSPFSLLVLTEFILDTKARGLDVVVWNMVRERRKLFRRAIAGSILKIDARAENSSLPLEWLHIDHPKYDDLDVTGHLREAGVACLPGRFFHWSMNGLNGHKNVRFALLKPGETFEHGLPQLTQALLQVGL